MHTLCKRMDVCGHIRAFTHINKYTCIYTHALTHIQMHTYTLTCLCTDINTHWAYLLGTLYCVKFNKIRLFEEISTHLSYCHKVSFTILCMILLRCVNKWMIDKNKQKISISVTFVQMLMCLNLHFSCICINLFGQQF